LDQCSTESQSLSHQLSPPILDRRGLLPALSWLAIEHDEKHGLRVTTDFDTTAEPADPVVRTILFHAVRELLFNIVKHANVRKAEVTVTSNDQFIRIEVRDAGVGFDPIAAGEKSSALGLHSIRERLRLFGGELELIATPGKGARAILRAPLKRVTSPYPETANPELFSVGPRMGKAPSPAETRYAEHPIKILLVDDHPVLRTSMAEMLAPHAGFSVIAEAGDGIEAVATALRLKPDVILMDVSMPHLNGIEATRRILAKLPEARVIGFSLHESATMAQAMRDAGAIDYFRKNEPVAVLLEKILSHFHPS
jgi:CheY-like chemotaxis protein